LLFSRACVMIGFVRMRNRVMQILISSRLTQDLAAIVHAAFASHGIVNVPKIAERVRGRHESENVALEDIAELVMRQAERIGAPMEFSSPIASTDQPVRAVNNAGAPRPMAGCSTRRWTWIGLAPAAGSTCCKIVHGQDDQPFEHAAGYRRIASCCLAGLS